LGFNVAGVRILPESIDLRSLIVYSSMHFRHTDDPVGHISRLRMSFPKSLLGYKDTSGLPDSLTELTPTSLRQSDLPEEYKYANVAHLCPMDFLTHSLMPAVLRQAGLTAITLAPGDGYMNNSFWNHLPALLTGLTAFMPTEIQLRNFFKGRNEDIWEMVEALAAYGCELIVVRRGAKGQLLYDATAQDRYEIPAYPSRVVDPTGAGDAFCGGFLAGYRRSYDPLQAVLHGNVSASFVIEGSGPFYAADTLTGLAQARLDTLPEVVRKV
jgi:sugar/nucleoside kinase (ribokinase family)